MNNVVKPYSPEKIRQEQNKNWKDKEELYITNSLRDIYNSIVKAAWHGEGNQYLDYDIFYYRINCLANNYDFSIPNENSLLKILADLANNGYFASIVKHSYIFSPYKMTIYWDKRNTELINIDSKHKVLKGYWNNVKETIASILRESKNIGLQSLTWERDPTTDINSLESTNTLIATFSIKRWHGLLPDTKITLCGNTPVLILSDWLKEKDVTILGKVQHELYFYSQLFKEIVINTRRFNNVIF